MSMMALGAAAWRRAGGGGGGYATLNPADKSALVSLSSGNLVATGTVDGSGIARSVQQIIGKKYFEAVVTDLPPGYEALWAAGVATDQHPLSASLGFANPYGWAVWSAAPGVRHNGTTVSTMNNTIGDVFGFAVDQAAGLMWIRANGGWITGDPAEDAPPIFNNLTGAPLYAAASPWGGEQSVVTMRFNPASFLNPAPVGFGPITE